MKGEFIIYRISWIAFVCALFVLVLIPAGLYLVDAPGDDAGGDRFNAQIGVVLAGLAASTVLLLVSFISGAVAIRRRRLALVWVVLSGLGLLVSAYLFFTFMV